MDREIKSSVGHVKIPLDIHVEMAGGLLWMEYSQWGKGVSGKVSGGGPGSRPVLQLEQPLYPGWVWASLGVRSSAPFLLGPLLASV